MQIWPPGCRSAPSAGPQQAAPSRARHRRPAPWPGSWQSDWGWQRCRWGGPAIDAEVEGGLRAACNLQQAQHDLRECHRDHQAEQQLELRQAGQVAGQKPGHERKARQQRCPGGVGHQRERQPLPGCDAGVAQQLLINAAAGCAEPELGRHRHQIDQRQPGGAEQQERDQERLDARCRNAAGGVGWCWQKSRAATGSARNASAIASSAISATCRLPPRISGAANSKSRAAETATGPIGPVFCVECAGPRRQLLLMLLLAQRLGQADAPSRQAAGRERACGE